MHGFVLCLCLLLVSGGPGGGFPVSGGKVCSLLRGGSVVFSKEISFIFTRGRILAFRKICPGLPIR